MGSIEYDSRKIQSGSVFVCIRGEKSDGHDYMLDAARAGASRIVVEPDHELELAELKAQYPNVTVEIVPNTRVALAFLASEYYSRPSSRLSIIAVTGTNGKTTTTHLIQNILSHKFKCALLGTMGFKASPQAAYIETGNTTPQSRDIQQILSEMQDYSHLTMEVSSHALEQHRTDAIEFKTAIVTNLTQDHLDYHKTMDRYFEAKARIFRQTTSHAVLNLDDPYYPRFAKAASEAGLRQLTYSAQSSADLRADNLSFSSSGLAYDLIIHPNSFLRTISSEPFPERLRLKLHLNALFNVYNSLAAIAASLLEGLPLSLIQTALEASSSISGRFETLQHGDSPLCVVDYAHSPDGLDNVLRGARALLKSEKAKLICVFGCGGDRDITKRPKMGRIAYELADQIYITSDNPRSEDPQQIIADILSGIPDLSQLRVIPDRATAIREAVSKAAPSDIVVIAGKGHEDYQILKDRTIHFDDREQVRALIGLST